MQQGNAFAFGLFLQNPHIFFFFLFVFFADDADAGLVFVTVQNRRNGNAEILCQTVDIFGKLAGGAGRETDAFRFVGFVEIVNVNPVAGGGTGFGRFFQNAFDQAGFAGALGA